MHRQSVPAPPPPAVADAPGPQPGFAEPDGGLAARHLVAEYAIARLLGDTRPFKRIVPDLIAVVCEAGGWQIGALWTIDGGASLLRCVDLWRAPGHDFEAFEAVTRRTTFRRGVGLPGRIWAGGTAVQIEDVTRDTNFPRAPYAADAGLHGAYGFPVHVGGRVVGVLECFSREPARAEPDRRLFEAIGAQVGHFIEVREAQETRERLAAIVDSSDDAIVSKTLDGVITSWNRGAENIFGYTAQEAIGRNITIIIPAERRDEEESVLARLRRGEKIDHFETERQTKDGRRIAVSLTVSPLRDGDGVIVGASKVARDITAQKRSADATRLLNRVGASVASRLDRESIVQTVTDLSTEITTAEFGAFFYNVVDARSGEAMLLYTLSGAPREAFARFPMPRATALFGPTLRGEGIVRIADVAADPRYGRSAPHHGMPAGHLPVRSYLAVPVKSRAGEVLGALFFGHSAPNVFTELHEELAEGIAAWASIALENARLYAAAEQAVQARDDFLSVAAHELRNPLNALQLQLVGLQRAAQAAEEPLPAGFVGERLGQATDDVGGLVRLVHNLLDVARLSAGRLDLEAEDVDLAALVAAVAAGFRQQLGDRPVTLDLAPVAGRWDRLRLTQVVTNLVSNAVKYGDGKPIEIRLRADERTAQLVVRDHGIGIDPARQKHLFERFERAVPRNRYGGFGLGLWITRETLRAMDGAIALESQPGAGSTFTVTLPLRAAVTGSHGAL